MPNIAIIGATSWGTTLGTTLASEKMGVRLWARTEEEANKVKKGKINPNVARDPAAQYITITTSLREAMSSVQAVILAVPSQSMRTNIKPVASHLTKSMLVISASKGLEIGSNKRMTQVIAEEIDTKLQYNICVLSGPNLAKEIQRNLPASTVLAARDEATAIKAQQLLATPNFRVYTNTDIIGVELGGALKNIIALGAGMVDGMNYGDNAKASFITRGLTEMIALGVALGASPLTFSGLAGLGDLIATCASPLSRNHYVGVELTKGRSLEDITKSMNGVAEGVSTTVAAWNLAEKLELEMPITEKLYKVLYQGLDPRQATSELLGAGGKHELAGRRWKLFSLFRHRTESEPI